MIILDMDANVRPIAVSNLDGCLMPFMNVSVLQSRVVEKDSFFAQVYETDWRKLIIIGVVPSFLVMDPI